MKIQKIVQSTAILILAIGLNACGDMDRTSEDQTTQVSEIIEDGEQLNNTPWVGSYEGTFPCADCPGIEVKIELNEDMSYIKTETYLESETPNTIEEQGTFQWKEVKDIVVLESPSGQKFQYLVEKGRLIALQEDGIRVTGELADQYILWKK